MKSLVVDMFGYLMASSSAVSVLALGMHALSLFLCALVSLSVGLFVSLPAYLSLCLYIAVPLSV